MQDVLIVLVAAMGIVMIGRWFYLRWLGTVRAVRPIEIEEDEEVYEQIGSMGFSAKSLGAAVDTGVEIRVVDGRHFFRELPNLREAVDHANTLAQTGFVFQDGNQYERFPVSQVVSVKVVGGPVQIGRSRSRLIGRTVRKVVPKNPPTPPPAPRVVSRKTPPPVAKAKPKSRRR